MTPNEALKFVERHGIVLQAARGPLPNLAEAVAGGAIRGSWWSHPKARAIYRVLETVSEHPDVLVCRLVDGKVTYVHCRLWPALVRLASRFRREQLAEVWDEHTPSGKHVARKRAFPQWVPAEVLTEAQTIPFAQAEHVLQQWLGFGKATTKTRKARSSTR
jgi:hypothetical protein